MISSSSNSPLPFHQRYGNAVSSTSSSLRRGTFRVREKYFIAVAAFIIMTFCFSGFMFLPDGPEPVFRKAFKDAWHANAKDLVIAPPRRLEAGKTKNEEGNKILIHEMGGDDDPHKEEDKRRLWAKIDREQIPKPLPEADQKKVMPKQTNHSIFSGSLVNDEETEKKRQTIKEMMILAWDSYAKHAWGENELRPLSKTGHSASIFGKSSIGASIIDGLDTLYIMGLLDRFEKGRKWVELSLDLSAIHGDLSVFETNIRFLGGLLSCYALTNDELFVRRAIEIADMLLPAFDTPTGIPYALINVRTRSIKNWGWASSGASILSEFGTLQLEFEYLSVLTGRSIYKDKVAKIRSFVSQIEKPGGLYPNYLHPKTGTWAGRHTSLGALGDSFYEYLVKSWLITNKRDEEAKRMYDEAIEIIYQKLVKRSTKTGLVYVAEWRGASLEHKMDHLACFVAGMFGLHAKSEPNTTLSSRYMDLAKEIGRTCHESYIRTSTRLGPEAFRFTSDLEAQASSEREKYYILRPEVIEAYFYLWRLTKDPMYRDWAWDAVQAIEKHCKTPDGYSGIRNVDAKGEVDKDDVQQSYFLAETLKYLYLTFSPDDVIPLDKWVFNTEAHPLPVRFNDEDHFITSFKSVANETNSLKTSKFDYVTED